MSPLASVLVAQSEAVSRRWRARLAGAGASQEEPEILALVPVLLRELVSALDAGRQEPAANGGPSERRHRDGFDLEAVVLEYAALHDSILDVVEEAGLSLERGEVRSFATFFSRVTSIAAREHSQRLAALSAGVRASEAQLRLVMDAIPLLVSFVSLEARYVSVNKAYETWFGIAAADLVGRSVREVIGEVAYSVLEPYVRRGLAGERFSFEQYGVPYRLGGTRDVKVSFVPQRTESGAVHGYVAILEDITQRRALEAEARRLVAESAQAHREEQAARAHLQALFMLAPTPICILRGPEHRFELVNPKYRALIGNRDVVGLAVRAALPELEGQGFYEVLDQVYASGERFVGNELPILLTRSGRARLEEAILNFVYEPFREADGSMGGILVLATDVTNAVRARRALEQALANADRLNVELAEAENVVRDLVNNLPELAWSAQPDGNIDFYNQRWFDYTGSTLAELKDWGWKKVHDPALLPTVLERWAHSLSTGEPFEMEFPLRGADGSFRWFLTRVRPLRDRSGKIVRWFGTNTNIHEQREAIRQIEQASHAKDEFLATASHELRTPLTAILGWARMLRSGQLDPSGYSKGLETIERNAKAQVQLIEDILDGSRIITGKLHLEIRPLDLTALVNSALDAVRPAADAKGIQLSLSLDPEAARVIGDPERLQQVVWNLANNAVKFTPRGGSVQVLLHRVGTHIELCVSDSGQGIGSEFLPHVFERFRQAEGSTSRRHGGLGLGLALVRHLVEAHGGTVLAESEGEGRGARFIVKLPVQAVYQVEPDADRPRVTPTEIVAANARPSLADVTILVVDDEVDARELVAIVLRSHGAQVSTAGSAAQALDLLSSSAPMLMISDIGMPDIDGYELMRRVRSMAGAHGAGIPAIALTAYSREQDRRLALEAGFQTHVAKPVEPAELVRVVGSLVQFVARQESPAEREVALERADTFLKLDKILISQNLREALRFLNSRTPHRFTAMYRFEPPTLKNLMLFDSYAPDVTKGDDAPMVETYCAIVGQTARSFTTEDARRDDRVRSHPARNTVISYCGVLLRDAEGKPFGTLCHFDLVPSDVPVHEMPLMEAAAPLLMKAVLREGLA